MKIKSMHIVSATSFIIAAQLLFFWLISTSSKMFPATYPFYTALTLAHTILLLFLGTKYRYPASFAPSLVGSIVTTGEMVTSILLGIFSKSLRTTVFVQSIILVVYILVMSLFVSVASKESVDSEIPDNPIRPYTSNSTHSVTTIIDTPSSRKPQAIHDDTN